METYEITRLFEEIVDEWFDMKYEYGRYSEFFILSNWFHVKCDCLTISEPQKMKKWLFLTHHTWFHVKSTCQTISEP